MKLIIVVGSALVWAGCTGIGVQDSSAQVSAVAAPCSLLMSAPFSGLAGSFTNGEVDSARCSATTTAEAIAIDIVAGERTASLRLPLAGVVVNQPVSVERLEVAASSAHCDAWDGLVDLSQPLPTWRLWIELTCREQPELHVRVEAQAGTRAPYQSATPSPLAGEAPDSLPSR